MDSLATIAASGLMALVVLPLSNKAHILTPLMVKSTANTSLPDLAFLVACQVVDYGGCLCHIPSLGFVPLYWIIPKLQ